MLDVFLIVLPIAVILALIGYFIIFKKNKTSEKNDNQFTGPINVEVIEKYMFRKEIEFYYFLQSFLPGDKIVFPKVGVDKLLLPTGNKLAYNNIMSKYVDFVIFDEKTMKPLLILDVYDNSYNDEILDEQEPFVAKVLNEIKLPLISILIKGQYDKDEIKNKILGILSQNNEEK